MANEFRIFSWSEQRYFTAAFRADMGLDIAAEVRLGKVILA